MKSAILSLLLASFTAIVFAQSGPIAVNVVSSEPGTGITIIDFEFTGNSEFCYNIEAEVKFDNAEYVQIPKTDLSGYLENVCSSGTNFSGTITWNGKAGFPNLYHETTTIRLTAYPNCPSTYTDPRDGQTYSTVQIGNQCWMKENLRYLPSVVGPATGSETVPYYYVYDYNGTDVNIAKGTANFQNYGVLYNWPAAITACPPGWILPTRYPDFSELAIYLQFEEGIAHSSIANSLKSCRQVNSPLGGDCSTTDHPRWDEDTNNGNYGSDPYGFSMLPAGDRYHIHGTFRLLGKYSLFWTSSEWLTNPTHQSYYYFSRWDNGLFSYSSRYKSSGFSVRCLRE